MLLKSYLLLSLLVISACAPAIGAPTTSPSPLADAAKLQDREALGELLRQDVDVDAAQIDGMTALHWAVYYDDQAAVDLIIAAGANVNAVNRYGVAPLSIACRNGNAKIVEALLHAKADPNAKLPGDETPLMTAARTGKMGPVEALIKHGVDVNAQERHGQTALMWAAAEGHAAVVGALMEAGADYQSPLKSGFTPWFFAAREGRGDVLWQMLAAGVDVNQAMTHKNRRGKGPRPGTSALLIAVENGHFELAQALLDAGANPNDDRCGFTPLHAITWVRKPARGDGDPPPMGSGKVSSLDFVRALIAHGADVNARHGRDKPAKGRLSKTDATPLLFAAESGDIPLMKLLVENGADPTLVNSEQCTPLLAAAGVGVIGNGLLTAGDEEEAIEAIAYLLELGADINAVDANGSTAMHGAAFKSWTQVVQFLVDNGADATVWNQKNKWGWTPLLIALGHRPGNFRPSAETEAAIRRVMQSADDDASKLRNFR